MSINEELASDIENALKAMSGTFFKVENDGLDDKKNVIIYMNSYPGPLEESHRIGDLSRGKHWTGTSQRKCNSLSIAWTDSCGLTRLLHGTTHAVPQDYMQCIWMTKCRVETIQIVP